ncbi:hypothetical protein FAZ69_07295 [Trinickia terrae]|uniref:Uncharacterized protein n=1 Tax=Trinickia terrae TaxID=2571161 RepID=A0A4V5PJF9_9BURK|nr:hypothetical protein [Trinickia terrae]TKC91160.1 hypothetical protein FAZ69_07295 [Trinickia terrae]
MQELATAARRAAPPMPEAPKPQTTVEVPEQGQSANAILAKSPTLQKDLRELAMRDWRIRYGDAGKGSMATRVPDGESLITLDSIYKNNPRGAIQTLAHEVGHAQYIYTVDFSNQAACTNSFYPTKAGRRSRTSRCNVKYWLTAVLTLVSQAIHATTPLTTGSTTAISSPVTPAKPAATSEISTETANTPPSPIKPTATTTETGVKNTPENDPHKAAYADIWSFMAGLIRVVRAQDMSAFAKLLDGLREDEKNEYVTFYRENPVHLASGEHLRAFSVFNNHHSNRIGARFEISNRCLSRDEVKQHYPGWRIVGAPRGGSLEEQTLFEVDEDGFAYVFGFAEKARDCLNSFSVGPLRN